MFIRVKDKSNFDSTVTTLNKISAMDTYEKMRITDWALEDRPREKLLAKGAASLSDAELIAILIGSGNRNETAVELAQRILSKVDNKLHELGKLSINALMENKGIGEAKAISIVAALELGRRRKIAEATECPIIRSSKDIYNVFHLLVADLDYEEFWVGYLNRANKLIDRQRLSIGGVNQTVIDIKMVLKSALEKLASGIVLCHNHPSGQPVPSETDIDITLRMHKSAGFMDINLLDHIIICHEDYFSFADNEYFN